MNTLCNFCIINRFIYPWLIIVIWLWNIMCTIQNNKIFRISWVLYKTIRYSGLAGPYTKLLRYSGFAVHYTKTIKYSGLTGYSTKNQIFIFYFFILILYWTTGHDDWHYSFFRGPTFSCTLWLMYILWYILPEITCIVRSLSVPPLNNGHAPTWNYILSPPPPLSGEHANWHAS